MADIIDPFDTEPKRAAIVDPFDAVAPAPTSGPVKIGAEGFPDALRETLRGADWGARNLAGAGTAVTNLLEGGKQLVKGSELYNLIANGRFARQSDMGGLSQQSQADRIIAEEAPIGAIGGSIATALPMMAVGNAPAAVGAVSSMYGALQPAEDAAQRAINTGVSGVAGYAGQKVANKATLYVQQKLQDLASTKAKNAVLDQTLRESVDAGYRVPPSLMPDSGPGARILEGLSGKFKTNQAAGIKNQAVTDQLARKALGLADDAPLTPEVMQSIRTKAYQAGYAPVEQLGTIKTDPAFVKSLDDIVNKYQGASRSFPGASKSDILDLIDGAMGMHGGARSGGLRVPEFDAGDAIKMTQILRDDAKSAFASGNSALGKAQKEAAKAIEDQIERGLLSQGKAGADLLKGFRDARTAMAKAHTVEDAIREGGGRVDAMKLGARFQAGKPLTGELRTIGAFANNFGKEGVGGIPKSGNASPFTALDFMQTGLSAPLGMIAGGPAGAAAALGVPALRVGARYGVLSDLLQKGMARPDYALGAPTQTLGSLLRYAPVGGTVLGLNSLQK